MNALITGITGFTGSHLADELVGKGVEVYGTIRGKFRNLDNIDSCRNNVTLLDCDLTDYNAVCETILDSQPDIIYHLAAQTFVPSSWRAPQETYNTNVLGTLNILEAVRKLHNCKVLIAGSSEEYGMVKPEECPITESNPLNPLSPYAVSKVAQDLMGYQYFYSYGLDIIRTRCFNIIGPRSSDKIFTAAFAKQIAMIEKGLQKPVIKVGNLDTVRDLVDVRDVAHAYSIADGKVDYGDVYNITTGNRKRIGDVLDTLLSMSSVDIKIKQDPSRMRPSDVPLLYGSSNKFMKQTGWVPKYTFDDSIKDVLEYWRNK